MSLPLKKKTGFTYGDYKNWPDDERWEIIDGVPYNMSPAPSRIHQRLSIALSSQFFNYLEGKTCEVYAAPFDVILPEGNEHEDDIETIVQPDLVVVCDPDKLNDKGCKGAPDLIVEIISPSTGKKDLKDKFYRYERAGVKYYWLVYPEEQVVVIYKLNDGKYGRPAPYAETDKIDVELFKDFTIDLAEVFEIQEENQTDEEQTDESTS
jgi:Uma2 family endonuclease